MIDILRFTLPLFALGAAGFVWANRRVSAEVARARWLKFATYFLIVHGVLASALAGRTAVTTLFLAIVLAGAWELGRAVRGVKRMTAIASLLVFAAVSVAAIAFTRAAAPAHIAYLYVVVAAFDGLGQTGGQLIGHRRLAPVISPGKTVEGFITGLAGAVLAAWWFRRVDDASTWAAIGFGVFAAVVALGGDLAASWVKRRAGIKDYSRILPGQGGVLDRFDSLLAVAAVCGVLVFYAR